MTFEYMQLKVCEGCGSLWLRAIVVSEVYCGACARKLADFPRAGIERRPGRKRRITASVLDGAQ